MLCNNTSTPKERANYRGFADFRNGNGFEEERTIVIGISSCVTYEILVLPLRNAFGNWPKADELGQANNRT